jgi:hypothetical protein
VVDSSSTTNQYQIAISPPTATTPSTIQTIQQGVGFNQNLILQAAAGSGNIGIGLNTTLAKLHVGGTTIINNGLTCSSSLNVIGNIIGSGTALTNLNYNAITNKPDLSVTSISCRVLKRNQKKKSRCTRVLVTQIFCKFKWASYKPAQGPYSVFTFS